MSKDKKLNWIYKFTPFLYDAAIIGMTLYVALRSRKWLNMMFSFDSFFIVFALAAFYLFISFTTGKHFLVSKTKLTTYVSGVSTFIMIYLSMGVLSLDIINLFVRLFTKDALLCERVFKTGGFVVLAFVILSAAYAMINVKRPKIVNYKLTMPSLKENYRLIFLSDLHIGFYVGKKHMEKVKKLVDSLNGDIVLITGDMINAGNTKECEELPQVEKIIASFKSKEGIFAVVGNHDPDVNDADFKDFLKKSDIHLLEDEVYTNGKINLMGRTTKLKKRASIKDLKKRTDESLPIVAMDHDPVGIKEAGEENIDLILCGHTHRGQIFPLNLFVRFLYSKSETYGMGREGSTSSIVSAGTGYFSMPMRLGSSCEVICVDLLSREQ